MSQKNKPLHIGIIPDGSRRWARQQGKPPWWNGWEAGEKVEEILFHVADNYPEVTEVTIWAMSIGNFERKTEDKQRVFKLVEKLLVRKESWKRAEAKVAIFGSKFDELPVSLRCAIDDAMERTKGFNKRKLNVGLGYGGKEEILLAVEKFAQQVSGEKRLNGKSRAIFEKFLMVSRPVDLVIRTGGEKRLSGFCPYQTEYAELFFLDSLWPDFTVKEFDYVMQEFQQRDRRFGR